LKKLAQITGFEKPQWLWHCNSMLPITSLQNPHIKLIRSLDDKKARREHGLFVVEGMQMLERAVALGWTPEHFIATKSSSLWDDVRPLLVSDKIMATLSAQNNPHDVLATFKQRWQAHPRKTGLWLALEDIRDPGNLGTIIRTADAAGADGIILVGECCDPFAPDCIRATTGSIFAVPLVKMPTPQFVDFLAAWPGDSVGASMTAKDNYRRDYGLPTVLVMGSESRGLTEPVAQACKTLVSIPMRAGVESLNVATATALMLFEANSRAAWPRPG
jgi:RNA methyltransferase, TrmH family